jgi:MoxR-like ATPase
MAGDEKQDLRMLADSETLQHWRSLALKLEAEVKKVMIGQGPAIRLLNIAIFARGHVLLEGDVGVGKTTLLQSIARAIGGAYERIEGTIDLMPSDLVYYTYISEDGKPRVAPGPLLKHGTSLATFFFNEVNRARPQMHSLLLRVMAERSVTAFNRQYAFPHLQVFADRNRVEKEETFEIPSAARDRFLMEVLIEAPDDPVLQRELMFDPRFHDSVSLIERIDPGVVQYTELNTIAGLIQRHIHATDTLQQYALKLCRATRHPSEFDIAIDDVNIEALILAGVSPRGMSMLLRAARVAAWLQGRDMLIPEDIHDVFAETIAHRVFFTPVYELRRSQVAAELMKQILHQVPVP